MPSCARVANPRSSRRFSNHQPAPDLERTPYGETSHTATEDYAVDGFIDQLAGVLASPICNLSDTGFFSAEKCTSI
jgi:hypothetical protein